MSENAVLLVSLLDFYHFNVGVANLFYALIKGRERSPMTTDHTATLHNYICKYCANLLGWQKKDKKMTSTLTGKCHLECMT